MWLNDRQGAVETDQVAMKRAAWQCGQRICRESWALGAASCRGPRMLAQESGCCLVISMSLFIRSNSYLLFHVCFSNKHFFGKAYFPLSLNSPTIFIKNLPGEQAAILGSCQQELVIEGEQYLRRKRPWRGGFLRLG